MKYHNKHLISKKLEKNKLPQKSTKHVSLSLLIVSKDKYSSNDKYVLSNSAAVYC